MALLLEFPKNVRVSRNDVYTEKHFNQSKNFDMILFQEGSPLPEHELNSFQYKLREDVIRLWEMIGDVFVDGGFKVQAPSTGALNNDFQVASGTCFLKGRACQLTSNILYSAQNIPSLPEVLRRAFWNSITFPEGYSVTPLTTPTATRVDLVVLTLALYEVRYLEEPDIIDADLGVETSGRLKVVPGITVIEGWDGSDFSAFFDYYNSERIFRIPLARITREANNTQITNAMITDLRPFIIGEGMKHLVLMDKTGSVTIPGNLTVMGDNAILNVETYEVEDNEILLNSVPSDDPDIPAVSGGVSVKRGKQSGVERPYATMWWDESTDKWQCGIKGSLNYIATEPYVQGVQSVINETISDLADDVALKAYKTYVDSADQALLDAISALNSNHMVPAEADIDDLQARMVAIEEDAGDYDLSIDPAHLNSLILLPDEYELNGLRNSRAYRVLNPKSGGVATSPFTGICVIEHFEGDRTVASSNCATQVAKSLSNHSIKTRFATVDAGGTVVTWSPWVTITAASGAAAKAVVLETPRNINGVPFDGSSNITITAAANGGNAATANSLIADAPKQTLSGGGADLTSSVSQLELKSNDGGAVGLTFHRPSAYAIKLMLGTDNKLHVGGWSAGQDGGTIVAANFEGTAFKIRQSALASPQNGDIWIE